MSDDDPIVELLVAIINQAHADARHPRQCSIYEKGIVRRDALEFLEWAVREGEELRENLARHIPHRAIRATRSWEMVANESTQEQLYNWKSNQRRRGRQKVSNT